MTQLATMQQTLTERRQQQLHRSQRCMQPLPDGKVRVQGKDYLNFSGNDYLGLAQDSAVLTALAEGAARFGLGSTGSPLVTGHQYPHQALCEALCDWLGFDEVLLFSSGFAANQTMLQTLVANDERILLDKLSHASLIDAATAHAGGFKRFLHNDLSSLQQLLTQYTAGKAVVVTEGVFSMDGDSPDLAAMAALCAQHQAPLLLDDAHGLGVFGAEGRGSWQQQRIAPSQLQALMANFGKALGGSGGFIAASATVIDYLRQFGRHYIYSTALSPALCWAQRKAVQLCRQDDWRRERLQQHLCLFQQLAQAADLPLLPSGSAIQPVLVGDASRCLAVSQALQQKGIWLTAIRPPTVAAGKARLRITLSAAHQPEQIRTLVAALQELF
ncbi:8-amino-7-oxononanoate synthase [Alkalimonas sp.]|uniref:aminotransferase class I/II-fold pyridoxal phosphate-dependent enzyme n=1 Tax=Alkalimonas sp. TaxID=1872453 RepID=UPI00263A9819|nr:8-amino-7-oxononanoate synthase [Alkalimonas sp.]MCC5825325.1 8-amino-7-oxononanoate synthase [Alkalimonas sp.]